MHRMPLARIVLAGVLAGALALPAASASEGSPPPDTTHPILFVTQVPVPADFSTVGSTFASHRGAIDAVARGGDLWIRYPDGTLRNLTAEAGYGSDGFQGDTAIAVRQPCVHFDGTKAVFSMIIGAPPQQYQHVTRFWQLYEVTGLGPAETAVITAVPGQPQSYNNVSPLYASDGRILFTSDRPHNGAAHLYPQQDEYESTPTNTGLWSLDPATGDLRLMNHAPSGVFWPRLDSTGRLLFTKWDHLQRDQQADADAQGGSYGTYNYTSETPDSVNAGHNEEVFPEPRGGWISFVNDNLDYSGPLRGWAPHLEGHTIEIFQLWQLNQDGTEEETLNHVGRHELQTYFNRSFNNDPSLFEFIAGGHGSGNRLRNTFQVVEDPLDPGVLYAIDAPTFGTHACGQIVRIGGAADVNPDDMEAEYVTHRDTASASNSPSPAHSGLYRNPLPLTNGLLLAVHTAETRADANDGTTALPQTRYDLRIKSIEPGGAYRTAGTPLTAGIVETVTWWNPDVLVTWSGPLWELDPVEVVARPTPPDTADAAAGLEMPELDAFAAAGVAVESVRVFLRDNDLALVVSRDVTTRDAADRQQPFNLRVTGTPTQTVGDGGVVYDVSYLQFFQGDLIRGIGSKPGRRVLAQPMHDASQNPPLGAAPDGSVRLGDDGSMAALVPARRAMSWQLTDDAGEAVVRERYWLSFQPGEIRTCTSCHGVNTTDQALAPTPQNSPLALRDLLAFLRDEGHLTPQLTGDLDGDGDVDVDDLVALLLAWGTSDPQADLDGDGVVAVMDLVTLIVNWTS